jgi:hypothetical protein
MEKGFSVNTRLNYSGEVFTVANAELIKKKGKGNDKPVLFGERVARRSHIQERDFNLGRNLAINRAVTSIWKKFHRKHPVVHDVFQG